MKKLYIILGSGVIVSTVGISTVLLVKHHPTSETNVKVENSDVLADSVYRDTQYGVSITYPTNADVLKLTDQDIKDKFILKFQYAKSPEYSVNLRAETGLRLPSKLAKLDVIDVVVDGALKSLPNRYPQFKLLSQEDLKISGKDAVLINFNYIGPAKELIHQELLLIEKDADTALYLSLQSRESDYNAIATQVFAPVKASIKLEQ